jgi:hypothetical protein
MSGVAGVRRDDAVRALERLLIWQARLRASLRSRERAIEPSPQDVEAFALDRYSPAQQREIVKLIARQPVIGRSDIDDALRRARRKARLIKHAPNVATALGFIAIFVLGAIASRPEPVPASNPEPATASGASASGATLHSSRDDGSWSPGGFDEADRQFFADVEAGRIVTMSTPPLEQPQLTPAAAPGPRPIAQPAAIAASQPAPAPAPQPAIAHSGTLIQLGAFADAAVAKARWQVLSTQFPSLRPLTQIVSPVTRGGRTLYRLQASGGDAAHVCSALMGAGANCFVARLALVPLAKPSAPAPARPATAHRETVIQLGAFADAAVAQARWRALSLQFPSLRPLTQTVSTVARGGRSLYRLRASGVDAASACSALAVAGATCFVATDAG